MSEDAAAAAGTMDQERPELVVESLAVNATNATMAKALSTPEGTAVAYLSLMLMALGPIFFGSFRSVLSRQEAQETSAKTGMKPETMSTKDAAMFPLIASAALFGLYVFFRIFSKENINQLLSLYFFTLGIFALHHTTAPTLAPLLRRIPGLDSAKKYRIHFTETDETEGERGEEESRSAKPKVEAKVEAKAEGDHHDDGGDSSPSSRRTDLIDLEFDVRDVAILVLSAAVGVWYLMKKHWVANNMFGLAFAVNGVELLHLNKVAVGCILLGGLFFYDVFWVFGTDVMVTVAKSFDAPIKLVFPQDLLEKGPLAAENMAMLGLGDIVIPGIFIALLLRYDISLRRNSRTYFYTGFLAYLAGLVTTIVVMHVFKHAQPALLYLVPACLGAPIFVALVKGDLGSMFSYSDHPDEDEEDKKASKKLKGGDAAAAAAAKKGQKVSSAKKAETKKKK